MIALKAIVGLGNPGMAYLNTRHNVGFKVVDALAKKHGAEWRLRNALEFAEVMAPGGKIILLKPLTFMNASGTAFPFLTKQGIKPEEVLVVHDELELPFGKVTMRQGGSARGHNGLRSIIATVGENFHRMRCGVGRPQDNTPVGDYVLKSFSEGAEAVNELIEKAVVLLEKSVGLTD
ncbi:TPA: aminoacyl-tRNA hydrolase [Candidatus Dependentiae bacterium]|nr:MAG: Peptidyl-tRNA hydrolase [candidate division TM6 bacterium GW2011_GWF2_43_87]HBL98258.1 aminoacyl-tRNA hydrolase [Candidatus Dependentiae bacterium]